MKARRCVASCRGSCSRRHASYVLVKQNRVTRVVLMSIPPGCTHWKINWAARFTCLSKLSSANFASGDDVRTRGSGPSNRGHGCGRAREFSRIIVEPGQRKRTHREITFHQVLMEITILYISPPYQNFPHA